MASRPRREDETYEQYRENLRLEEKTMKRKLRGLPMGVMIASDRRNQVRVKHKVQVSNDVENKETRKIKIEEKGE